MTDQIVTAQTEALLAEFARSGLRELHIRRGDIEIYLSNDPSSASPVGPRATATAAAPSPPVTSDGNVAPSPPRLAAAAVAVPENAVIIRAPNLGTFYGAPKPGAAAYVAVGSVITPGAELCLIEVMKLFTAVRAEVGGRVAAILATDGDMVEAGQPLFAIVEN